MTETRDPPDIPSGQAKSKKSNSKRYRFAFLTSHPIEYQVPLFRALADHAEIDLTVYFCCDMGVVETLDPGFGVTFKCDIPLLGGYRHRFLSTIVDNSKSLSFFHPVNWNIIGEIKRNRFDVICVHGYGYFTNWLAFLAARFCGTPVLLRGESHLLNNESNSKRIVKGLVLRALFRQSAGALVIGSCNQDFYNYYGVPAERMFFTPYCVDNDFFCSYAEKLVPLKHVLRENFNIHGDDPVIVFCGKLIPRKQPLQLLEAFAQIRRKYPCSLLYAGEGELRSAIEKKADSEKIPNVHISGFLNQTEISKAYVIADILVLPSVAEPWGLVINEAMNFGVPVVASDKVGAAYDLVREGENGHIVPALDVRALTRALEQLVANPTKRRDMGEASRRIIQRWNLDRCVAGFVEALRTCSADRQRRENLGVAS